MASSAERIPNMRLEMQDFVFEERVSMYMLRQNKQREVRKKFLLHRLIFIARISPELADKRDLGGYYEQLYQDLQRYFQGDGVTGLLLLYPSYLLHIVESSNDVLFSVLRDLGHMQQQGHSALILEPRILVISHDIPNRLFQQWSYKVLSVPARRLTETEQTEPPEKLVSESLTMLMKLGVEMLKTPKRSKNSADSVLDKVPELIVPQDNIEHLLKNEALLTPLQYLNAYDCPINVVMDSGHVFGSSNPTTV
ncbi:testis-expressed protein 47-like isoform X3 [Polyodon spathula]|uniref:testis-expressed protein 47-like isoform X3 n=1 Tax=Polyodon spathula TaxID=7913 RepID=UPI001B7EB0C2|nr:testis-expressed protein 47-like isoform X3 [Polyodon spathula]